MSSKPVVPVFFTIDQSYIPWLKVALVSMKENADHNHLIRAHVVYQDLTPEQIDNLESLGGEDFEVVCSQMPNVMDGISDWEGNWLRADYFTLTIFFRLFLPDLFPEYDKAIYLDSDIVVPGNITELYDTDLQGNALGVVNDFSIAAIEPLVDYVENSVGVDHTRYFNSGMLLMDFKQLRDKKFGAHFLEVLGRQNFDTIAPDQDYLNAMCKDSVLHLGHEWDAMPSHLPELDEPKVIHYNLYDKPWCYDNVQYEDYFWNYAAKTDCLDEIKAHKAGYSKEQMESDAKAKDLLISKSGSLAHASHTMKSVFESGQEQRL